MSNKTLLNDVKIGEIFDLLNSPASKPSHLVLIESLVHYVREKWVWICAIIFFFVIFSFIAIYSKNYIAILIELFACAVFIVVAPFIMGGNNKKESINDIKREAIDDLVLIYKLNCYDDTNLEYAQSIFDQKTENFKSFTDLTLGNYRPIGIIFNGLTLGVAFFAISINKEGVHNIDTGWIITILITSVILSLGIQAKILENEKLLRSGFLLARARKSLPKPVLVDDEFNTDGLS
jgi:hypothetical protein